LNPDFIFVYPAYNVRNTEIGGILGRSSSGRLDANVRRRTANLHPVPGADRCEQVPHGFKLEARATTTFQPDPEGPRRRAGGPPDAHHARSGGRVPGAVRRGQPLRQPYLAGVVPDGHHPRVPQTEHVHFYGFYIGNFPDLGIDEVDALCAILNSV